MCRISIFFCRSSRTSLGPTRFLIQWITWVRSPGIKQPGQDEAEWSMPHTSHFTPGKETQCPLYKRLCGPLGWSGWVWTISPLWGFEPRTIGPRGELIYWLSCTNYRHYRLPKLIPNGLYIAGCCVLTALWQMCQVSWDVMLCYWMCGSWCFEGS
jgi:hypothetical protein